MATTCDAYRPHAVDLLVKSCWWEGLDAEAAGAGTCTGVDSSGLSGAEYGPAAAKHVVALYAHTEHLGCLLRRPSPRARPKVHIEP